MLIEIKLNLLTALEQKLLFESRFDSSFMKQHFFNFFTLPTYTL